MELQESLIVYGRYPMDALGRNSQGAKLEFFLIFFNMETCKQNMKIWECEKADTNTVAPG